MNAVFKRVLNYWAKYLTSKASRSVLHKECKGWLSPAALKAMVEEAECDGKPFHEVFECKPCEDYYGFKSWDDFFTRKFCEGNLFFKEGEKAREALGLMLGTSLPDFLTLRETFFTKLCPICGISLSKFLPFLTRKRDKADH